MSKTNTHNYKFLPACPLQSSNSHDFILQNRQQPIHARISTNNERDRRPIDPPPIVQIRLRNATQHQNDAFHQDSYFFMCANLVHPTNDTEIYTPTHNALSGQTSSSMYKLKDVDNSDCAFFIFGDLSVKVEGSFRLKLSLFQVTINGAVSLNSLFTNVFTVYSTRKFPGVLDSTFLSRSFSDQGARIRIRKENRAQTPVSRKRKLSIQDQPGISSPLTATAPHLILPLTSHLSPPNHFLQHQEKSDMMSPDTYCDRRSSLASSGTESTSCSEINSSAIYTNKLLHQSHQINTERDAICSPELIQKQVYVDNSSIRSHNECKMQITAPSFSNQLQSCQEYIQLPPPSIKLSNKPISDSTLELPPLRNIVRNKRLKTNDMEGEAVAAMIQLSQFSEKK